MPGRRSAEIELLLGIGKEERSSAPEPALLPFLAKVAPESSLDFLCSLNEGFAKGDYSPHVPWPVLGGAVLSIVSERLSNLEDPDSLRRKHPALIWFEKSGIEERNQDISLSALESDPWIIASFDWLHPNLIPDHLLAQGIEQRLELVNSVFEVPFGDQKLNFASPIHLMPIGKEYVHFASDTISVIERSIESGYTPQWLLALAISRLSKITSQDNKKRLLDLVRAIEQPWSTNLISVMYSSRIDAAYSDVLYAHPGVYQFFELSSSKQAKLKRRLASQTPSILDKIIQEWGGAPPVRVSMVRKMVSTVSHTFRGGFRLRSFRSTTPPNEFPLSPPTSPPDELSSSSPTASPDGFPFSPHTTPPDEFTRELLDTLLNETKELVIDECASPEEAITRMSVGTRDVSRRVQADVFLKDDCDDRSCMLEHAFVAGKQHKVFVWVGFGGTTHADKGFPDDELSFDGDYITLDVFFIEGEHVSKDTISLPKNCSKNSTLAEFDLIVDIEKRVMSTMIVIMYKGRTLQVLQLTGMVVPDVASEKTDSAQFELTVMAITHGFEGLEDRVSFDASVFVGEDEKVICLSKSGEGYVNPDGMQDRVNEIASLLFDTSKNLDSTGNNLESKTGSDLFRELAIYGKEFFTEYVKNRFLDRENIERIQITTADPSSYLPLEFIYSGPSPSDKAMICPEWKNALETGECAQCRLEQGMNSNRVDIICPLKFWGLSKVIERHVGKRKHMDGYPHWIRLDTSGDANLLNPVSSALFASSTVVPESSVEQVIAALKQITEDTVEVDSWPEWIDAVKKHTPSLIVCMPHNSAEGRYEELHLGNGSALRVGEVDERHVIGKDMDDPYADGPMIMILGCETGLSKLHPYLTFIDAFSTYGASIVIGMLSTVLADQAPIIVREILSLMEDGNGRVTLGDVLLEVRRRVFSQGFVIGLAVAGFGDADSIISS